MLLLIQHSAFAQTTDRWQLISNNDNGSRSYLERSAQNTTGDRRRTWTKDIYRDDSYKVTLVEWRCREKKFRVLEATNYAPEGKYLGQEEASGWATIVPDSVSENYFKIVCAARENISESDASNEKIIVQVIAQEANVREAPFSVGFVMQTVVKGTRFVLADTKPVGVWYQVLIPDTDQTGWLHGNTIKIIKTEPNRQRTERKSKPAGKRRVKRSN